MENKTNGKVENAPASMAGIGTHEIVLEQIRKYLPEPSRIADLAAGEGAFSVKLKELGHDVTAIDASRDYWKATGIDLQIQNLDSEFAEKIVNNDNKFDAVVAIEIIEHLENPFRFARECAKLLKPGGFLFLTTPNVEAVFSRLIFLYTGRLNSFGAYETVRPAHITPIFRWKLEMLLDEANFEIIWEGFNPQVYAEGTNLKVRLSGFIARILSPFLKGDKGDESRIVIARLK
jgi:2-polyprenyl-3-methyl-5-hydroxy-6-metoxy-1,4-benzoquinol methylase